MNSEGKASLARRLQRISTATAMDILREHEPERLIMRDVKPVRPAAGTIAGPARTLRFLPRRHDVRRSPAGSPQFELIDTADAGDVLVLDAMGWKGGSVLGDMLATRAERRGVVAVVTDGVMRDVAGMKGLKLGTFATGLYPTPSLIGLVPWEFDVPAQCGGVLVLPGDWVLADAEAAIVIPKDYVAMVADSSDAVLSEEEFSRQLLLKDLPLKQSFPMPKPLQAYLDRFRKDGTLPSPDEVVRALDGAGRA